jgi:hypothetical protein
MHIFVHIYVSHIYVSYAMLNNIFAHLSRISCSTTRGYQLVIYIKMSSDWNWMYGSRLYNMYIKVLDAYIDFMKKYMLDNIRGNFCCPCKHCLNEKKYRIDNVLKSHLIQHGFMEDYQCWNKLGKEGLNEAEMRESYLKRAVSTNVEEEHDWKSLVA